MAAWAGWFESLGDSPADQGNLAFESAEVGHRDLDRLARVIGHGGAG
jgi:hypothetical protein